MLVSSFWVFRVVSGNSFRVASVDLNKRVSPGGRILLTHVEIDIQIRLGEERRAKEMLKKLLPFGKEVRLPTKQFSESHVVVTDIAMADGASVSEHLRKQGMLV